jgi:hypothetical protein
MKTVLKTGLIALAAVAIVARTPLRDAVMGDDKFLGIF